MHALMVLSVEITSIVSPLYIRLASLHVHRNFSLAMLALYGPNVRPLFVAGQYLHIHSFPRPKDLSERPTARSQRGVDIHKRVIEYTFYSGGGLFIPEGPHGKKMMGGRASIYSHVITITMRPANRSQPPTAFFLQQCLFVCFCILGSPQMVYSHLQRVHHKGFFCTF